MKTFRLFATLLVIALCAGFTSCSDDDEDENPLVGVWSLKYSNKIKAKAETEDKKAADVLNWLEDNITKEDIENSYTGDIQEEMKYFNRTAYVKEQLTVQFTELSDEEAENFSEQFVEKMFN